jgi:carbon storage regulator
MLVLSRKPGERILIGDNVTVTIVRIGPNNVRLGIEAPRELNIVREELCIPLNAIEGIGELKADQSTSTPAHS